MLFPVFTPKLYTHRHTTTTRRGVESNDFLSEPWSLLQSSWSIIGGSPRRVVAVPPYNPPRERGPDLQMSESTLPDDAEAEQQRNYTRLEDLETDAERVQAKADELEDVVGNHDAYEAVEDAASVLRNRVDDLQDEVDRDPADVAVTVEKLQAAAENLQDEVGFDDPDLAERLDKFTDHIEQIDEKTDGFQTDSAHVVYVQGPSNDRTVVFVRNEALAGTVIEASGYTLDGDDQSVRLVAIQTDSNQAAARFKPDETVKFTDPHRTRFRVSTRGGGNA